jgi:hypothetical protein
MTRKEAMAAIEEVKPSGPKGKYGSLYLTLLELGFGESVDVRTSIPAPKVQNSLWSRFRRDGINGQFRVHVISDRRLVIVKIDPEAEGNEYQGV